VPQPAHDWQEVQRNLDISSPVWWLPLAYVGLVVAMMLMIWLIFPRSTASEQSYWADQPKRDVPSLDV